ncbi:alanine racemase [Lentzea guizhouensis]|uniref:alanine racemase n=1 Tax=Lentzea guizhouensis TaxID=1586287 RepID=UPI000A4059F6|nr:alanine racemase [Lentzea guizhouensis]
MGAPVTALRQVVSGPELQVDLAAVAENTRRFTRVARSVMAVVKADGFGHGLGDVARTALAAGASWIGVTSLEEALAVRACGVEAPVLSWLHPVDVDVASAVRHRVDLSVPSVEHLAAISGADGPVRVHLQLDTGMARDGAAPETWLALMSAARRAELAGRVRVAA